MVDDLDRCRPDTVTETLEAISLAMRHEHCVFVLGMDMRLVESAVERSYGHPQTAEEKRLGVESRFTGRRFLEKLVHVSVPLPLLDPALAKGYMNRLVPTATEGAASNRRSREATRTDGEAEATGTGNAATISAQRRDMKQVLEFMNSSDEAAKRAKIEAKYSEESKNVGQAILAIVPGLQPNPRQIKRFVNTFRIGAMMVEARGALEGLSLDDVGRWVWATMLSPQFAEAVINRPALLAEEIGACADDGQELDERWRDEDLARLLKSWEKAPDIDAANRLVRV